MSSSELQDGPLPSALGDRRDFTRFAAWLLTSQYVASALGLLFTLVAARALGPRGYGLLSITVLYPTLVIQVMSPKAATVLTRYMARAAHREDQGALASSIRTSLLLDGAAAGLGFLFVLATAALAWRVLPHAGMAWPWMALVSSGLLLYSPLGTAHAFLLSTSRPRGCAALNLLDAVLQIGILLFVAASAGITPGSVVITVALAQACVGAVALAVVRPALRATPSSAAALERESIRLVGWNWLLVTSSGLAGTGPIVLVGWLAGPTSAGLLRLAQVIGNVASYIPAVMERVAYPRIAASDASHRAHLSRWTFGIGLPAAVIVAGSAALVPTAIDLVLDASFHPAARPATYLVLAAVLPTIFFWTTPHFYGRGRVDRLALIQLAYALVVLWATVVVTRPFGVAGVALALLLSRAVCEALKAVGAWRADAGHITT